MRDREEGRPSNVKKVLEEDLFREEETPSPTEVQSRESLKETFSWIRSLESQHPGWRLARVEGFAFTLPTRELSESRVALLSLAGVYKKGQKPFNISPTVVPADLRAMRFKDRGDPSLREIPSDTDPDELEIAHAHYLHSEADEDINCVFPLSRLIELDEEDFIGEVAPVHYSLMGYVPDVKQLLETVRKQILPGLKAHEVDLVIVSGGCALSHQSAGLIQREIEGAGIPTVGVTVCRDITYQLQVPRAVYVRFPLGNPFGSSMDENMQTRILRDALSLIHGQQTPGEIQNLEYEWVKL